MTLFTIDENKCTRCGACATECPTKIIRLKEDDPFPRPVKIADRLCIDCGHCVAVCPNGALSLKTMAAEDCPPVNKDWLLDADRAEHFLRYRRSIRTYKPEPVERDKLEGLIEIARYAQTGHNGQPVKWLVIYEEGEVKRLAGMIIDWLRHILKEQEGLAKAMNFPAMIAAWEMGVDVVCRDAPHLILTYAPSADPSSNSSCTIALTHLELAAPSLGLGTCWDGFFDMAVAQWEPLREALALPDGYHEYGSVMIGYPKYKYHRFPKRNEPDISWA